jgi:putative ABC transport system permease protein
MLAGYSLMMDIASAFALFIGMFLIYNSLTIAVRQRRSEIGILRALGATRSQIRWLFLGEGAALGLVGSAAGTVCGLLVARSVSSWIGALITNVYGVAQQAADAAASPALIATALLVGTGTSVMAAALPARDAARIDPVRALQKGRSEHLGSGESRLRGLTALSLLVAAGVCSRLSDSRPLFYLGYACAVGSSLLFGPMASVWFSRALRPLLKWLRPVEGALAADSLIQSPRRTSGSVVALMLSIALVVAFSGMGQASFRSILTWMDTTLDPDLFVLPSQSLDVQTTRFPGAMSAELAALPGISRVQAVRNVRVSFRQKTVMLVAVDVKSLAQTARLPPVEGASEEMYRESAEGRGVIVSDNLAQLSQLELGDTIDIAAPYGQLHLPIVGVVVDYSDQQGSIIVDQSLFESLWHDDTVNAFRVYVAPDARIQDVRKSILDLYAGRRTVFALTNDELKQYILRVAGQWFSLTSIQVLVAALVAVLGIVNTLTVAVTDRRREFGVLRAVGALNRQVRQTIWLEALSIATVGVILGCVLGALNLAYVLDMVRRDIAGMRLTYALPWSTMLALVPAMWGAAFVAALWPAESAVRGGLVEALEYE